MAEIITDGCTYTTKYSKPTENDNGDVFGELIETFMESMAAHTHDGDTSNQILLNIQKDRALFLNASNNWTYDISELSSYLTMTTAAPTTVTSNHFRKFYIGVNDPVSPVWEEFSPKIVWVDATTYKLYSNITDKDIKVYTI